MMSLLNFWEEEVGEGEEEAPEDIKKAADSGDGESRRLNQQSLNDRCQ